jgi:hypothetical protein
MKILLKNVRSFCKPDPIPLKPLTLLVGENSTGKTTFLSMLAHASQSEFPSIRPNFSAPPFDLGPFDSIATFRGGRGGRSDTFSVGFTLEEAEGQSREVMATYSDHKGQPQLVEITAKGRSGELKFRFDEVRQSAKLSLRPPSGERADLDMDFSKYVLGDYAVQYLLRAGIIDSVQKDSPNASMLTQFATRELPYLLRGGGKSVLAFAPVRTRPRRTFDETASDFDPEGDHIFVLLARLWQEQASPETHRVFDDLKKFGEESTLFKRIDVRRLGRKPSDPFQILVAMGGPAANLLDVGYGVSQVLPIVGQSVLTAHPGLLLLQQPEIHLHPRAQAALGSFFARLVASKKKELVVETHSDYLIDRIRSEVAQGTIQATDVLILFFDKRQIETKVYEISVDEKGNIQNAPKTYRQFFLDEEINLFNRATK